MDYLRYLSRNWYLIPKAICRLCFILVNNAYCIPTYVVWMVFLSPLRKLNPDLYWRIEGYFFHWLLAMVSTWSWSAGYDIVELGDDISGCLDDRTLVIANHQSTGDVPLLMATFNSRKQILPNIMWIMDSLFKYTNFGIVSVLHQDFFIMSGKNKRDRSLHALATHLLNSFIPLNRKWMVLFPEGGFLRKRKEISNRYAEKNNLPQLHHVSLPRIGALQVIMNSMGNNNRVMVNGDVKTAANNNSTIINNDNKDTRINNKRSSSLEWILDITIAYPDGDPIDLGTIVFGHRPPCKTTLYYRLYACDEVPHDSEQLTDWLFKRWQEKEVMLESFYRTGKFPIPDDVNDRLYYNVAPQLIEQDYLRFVILHLFFIISTCVHIKMATAVYYYCSCLIY